MVSIVLLFSLCAAPETDSISDYEFHWILAKDREASVAVIKTPDETYMRLTSGRHYLDLAERDAKAIGLAIQKSEEAFKSMAEKPADSQVAYLAADHTVAFYRKATGEQSVVVTQNTSSDHLAEVKLTPQQAKRFAAFLVRSKILIEKANRIAIP